MADTDNVRAIALKGLDVRLAELKDHPDAPIRKQYAIDQTEKAISDETRTARFVITTQGVDRDNDTVAVSGWDVSNYVKSPVVLWAHDYSQMPVARAIELNQTPKGLEALAEFPPKGTYAFADTVFEMLKGGFLSATSVGFRPTAYEPDEKRGGINFTKQELLEFSIVPVPANPEALIVARSKGIDVEPLLDWAERTLSPFGKKGTAWVPKAELVADAEALAATAKAPCATCGKDMDGDTCAVCADKKSTEITPERLQFLGDVWAKAVEVNARLTQPFIAEGGFAVAPKALGDDPVRWNRSLSKAFDVADEPLEPSRTELAWMARYFESKVQDLSQSSYFVPTARMGSYLAAFDEILTGWGVDATRNLTASGRELPPEVESIQLSSTLSRSFLVEGTRFMRRQDGVKIAIKHERHWSGLYVTGFCRNDQAVVRNELTENIHQRAKELNYLRGEAFTLGGEFLSRGDLDFSALFLEPAKEAVLQRTVELVNEDGEHMASRGLMLMGPPGTGKTLSGRVMMRQADSTFIWCSARDFYRSGGFGGLAYAFDLAAECAPSIIFIEDVDTFLGPETIDLLKTEMDGLRKRKGIVTILTTNFPELMPAALIDRPGRFHDVLEMGLPTAEVRQRMLAAWVPEAAEANRGEMAEKTDGLSGAHLFELVNFAKLLHKESKGGTIEQALETALAKITEQRDLVSSLHAQDYRPRRQVRALVSGAAAMVTKRGRVLSAINEGRLRTAQESLAAATGQLDGVLSQLAAAAEVEETGDKQFAVHLREDEPAPVVLRIAPDEPRATRAEVLDALKDGVLAAIGPLVRAETQTALARARGRVD